MSKEAMKLALNALEAEKTACYYLGTQVPEQIEEAIAAINQALVEPECAGMLSLDRLGEWLDASLKERRLQRQPLTDEEIEKLAAPWFLPRYTPSAVAFARAVEASHGI
jgi:hypothetical protein